LEGGRRYVDLFDALCAGVNLNFSPQYKAFGGIKITFIYEDVVSL
jgi:hypothetical protein